MPGAGEEISSDEWLNCAGGGMSLVRMERGLRCVLQGLRDSVRRTGLNGQSSALSITATGVVWLSFDEFISWISVNIKEIWYLQRFTVLGVLRSCAWLSSGDLCCVSPVVCWDLEFSSTRSLALLVAVSGRCLVVMATDVTC